MEIRTASELLLRSERLPIENTLDAIHYELRELRGVIEQLVYVLKEFRRA